jgi:hypothetical protein
LNKKPLIFLRACSTLVAFIWWHDRVEGSGYLVEFNKTQRQDSTKHNTAPRFNNYRNLAIEIVAKKHNYRNLAIEIVAKKHTNKTHP